MEWKGESWCARCQLIWDWKHHEGKCPKCKGSLVNHDRRRVSDEVVKGMAEALAEIDRGFYSHELRIRDAQGIARAALSAHRKAVGESDG